MKTFKSRLLFFVALVCLSTAFSQNTIKKTTSLYKWGIGAGIGFLSINGDVKSYKLQLSENIHLYKPIAKWFGLQLAYAHGNAKGINGLVAENFAKNTAWASRYAGPIKVPTGVIVGYTNNGTFTPAPRADVVYYNYKSTINFFTASAEFTIAIPFSKPIVGFNLSPGIGVIGYKTFINTLDENGNTYATLFRNLALSNSKDIDAVRKELRQNMDKTYETKAEDHTNNRKKCYPLSYGISWYINKKYETGILRTGLFTNSKLIDGQQWREYAYGDAVVTSKYDFVVSNQIYFRYKF